MSCCNTCQSKFSFFSKERGCPLCGFSYCTKCLKYEPEEKKEKGKICGPCFHKLKTRKPASPTVEDLPTPSGLDQPLVPFNITSRVETDNVPKKPPIIVYSNKLDKLTTGLDPADEDIVNRLKKLKDEDKQIPLTTEDEIRRRLALLRDQDPDTINKPINIHQVDARSEQQKVDDLISQYLEELEISKGPENVDSDIEARLKNLKEFTATLPMPAINFAEIASTSNEPPPMDCSEEIQDDLLDDNQCVMCDKRVDLVKCKGCYDDLYCIGCFNDNHDDFEMKKHWTVPFRS